jgi:DNA-binding cell septation regulator SpoVG
MLEGAETPEAPSIEEQTGDGEQTRRDAPAAEGLEERLDQDAVAPDFETFISAPDAPDFTAVNDPAQAALAEAETGSVQAIAAEIPLTARISSLEMEGATRAFAVAEYGDLTIRRIRVKEDDHGGLSVVMPKFREVGGFTDTCRFNSAQSRNRLGALVLDAYQQALRQLQNQSALRRERIQPEMSEPEMSEPRMNEPEISETGMSGSGMNESVMREPEMREPEMSESVMNESEMSTPEIQDSGADTPAQESGPVMGMSQW